MQKLYIKIFTIIICCANIHSIQADRNFFEKCRSYESEEDCYQRLKREDATHKTYRNHEEALQYRGSGIQYTYNREIGYAIKTAAALFAIILAWLGIKSKFKSFSKNDEHP